MELRRGFKKETNEYARELRKELNKEPFEPLCPLDLAKHLLLPIAKLSELAPEEAVAYLTVTNQDVFSAVTVFNGRKRLIVHNDSHHPNRQTANIAHELSHAILGHPPTPPFTDSGERFLNAEVQGLEDEANWMGPALLISEEAALHIVRQKMSLIDAGIQYGVSKQLLQMRINVTGAKRRVSRYK
ncbi:MAG: ImmA/IrrE family metallo-endopeptidase [Immundisolibacteraceae bacterium]|nr:ImmA/IrrE family metallo-endopeptidase [Immundisolibacteraceae bacterium]